MYFIKLIGIVLATVVVVQALVIFVLHRFIAIFQNLKFEQYIFH